MLCEQWVECCRQIRCSRHSDRLYADNEGSAGQERSGMQTSNPLLQSSSRNGNNGKEFKSERMYAHMSSEIFNGMEPPFLVR